MKSGRLIYSPFFLILPLIAALQGCAVVRTPYTESAYYNTTSSRLDRLTSDLTLTSDSLYAGFARVSITPHIDKNKADPETGKFRKIPLAGYGARRGKNAAGIHDSIFIKAIALKEADNTIVIIGADMLIMPPNVSDLVAESLTDKGISRNQLFFTATHSHSSVGGWAPGLAGRQFAGRKNNKLIKWIAIRTTEAIDLAIKDLQPAKVGTGEFSAPEFTWNRFHDGGGPENDDFNFIIASQQTGRKAVIGSYSAHATTLGSANMLLSADYPGFWENRMEGKEVEVAAFSAGSVGSQSPSEKDNRFESSKKIGYALADTLITVLKNVRLSPAPLLSSISVKIELPEYHFRLTMKRDLPTLLSKAIMPVPENTYLQAIRIDDLVWVFTPGDFSGELALKIKSDMALHGFRSVITSFNGGYVGYIMPGEYFDIDNYETKLMGWYGPQMSAYLMDLISKMNRALTR